MTDPLPCISLYIRSLRKWFNVVYNLNMLILQIVVQVVDFWLQA